MLDTKEQPIRIAQIMGKMVGGGVEKTVLNYYEHIDRTKIQYDFFVDQDSLLIPRDEIESYGGKIFFLPPYQNIWSYHKALLKVLEENKYYIVVSHMNTLAIFPMFVAWRANVPIRIAHNHSTAGKGELKRNLIKYFLRPFSKIFPTTLCACSEYAGTWLFGKKATLKKKIVIWKNAVNVDLFLYSDITREKIRKELELESKFVIGHAGRFINQKNHMFLVNVFFHIHKKDSNAILILIGTGVLMNEVKMKVNELNLEKSVFFLGNRNDISDIYQSMDVFLFPSFYEGLGMVAVEAQIAGLPVLAADTVPIESKICNNIKYLSLDDGAEKWANEALKFRKGFKRKNMKFEAKKEGYEISLASKKMDKWYSVLLNQQEDKVESRSK